MKKPRKTPVSKQGFFQRFLIEKRLNAGFSQKELAETLGWTSGQYVSNIERGLSAFPEDKMKRLSKVLKVPLPKLIRIMSRDYESALYERLKA